MKMSFITLERFVSERADKDPASRAILESKGRPLLKHGRAMSDEALLDRLHAAGLSFDQAQFLKFTEPFESAEAMARSIYEKHPNIIESECDWVWIAFVCLWERWQPERPSLEMLDDRIQEGYEAEERDERTRAAELWLGAWEVVWRLIETHHLMSVQEFDDRYLLTQCLSNWIQDFVSLLGSAGHVEPSFYHKQIAVLETILARLETGDLTRRNFQDDLAETYFEIGMPEKGEQLFRQSLLAEPKWGWSWIHWSDCYFICCRGREKDPAKAEEILKRGLSVPGVEDRLHMWERLEEIYSEMGRSQEAEKAREEIEKLKTAARGASKTADRKALPGGGNSAHKPRGISNKPAPRLPGSLVDSMLSPVSAERNKKVGRNDRCPCGSGKKYKKCCFIRAT